MQRKKGVEWFIERTKESGGRGVEYELPVNDYFYWINEKKGDNFYFGKLSLASSIEI